MKLLNLLAYGKSSLRLLLASVIIASHKLKKCAWLNTIFSKLSQIVWRKRYTHNLWVYGSFIDCQEWFLFAGLFFSKSYLKVHSTYRICIFYLLIINLYLQSTNFKSMRSMMHNMESTIAISMMLQNFAVF